VAYYSPFTRFWEIALGGLMALLPSAVRLRSFSGPGRGARSADRPHGCPGGRCATSVTSPTRCTCGTSCGSTCPYRWCIRRRRCGRAKSRSPERSSAP
jgi:hypothetical protein